jgi:small subunit ribosomal protein S11
VSAEEAAREAHELGLRKVKVFVKGPGSDRESAIRALHNNGVEVTEIVDITPCPTTAAVHPRSAAFNNP